MVIKHLQTALIASFLVTGFAILPQANAIMVYGSQDYNLIGPGNEYADVGYQYAGIVPAVNNGSYVKTQDGGYYAGNISWPISPNWALRANHVSANSTGYNIYEGGQMHQVVEAVRVGGSDLSLVRVDVPFSNYAYMYDPSLDGQSEVGKDSVIIGTSGTTKDHNSLLTTNGGTFVNGWNLANFPDADKGEVTWGRNRIEEVVPDVLGSEVLYSTFDQATLADGSANPRYIGTDEAAAFSGDSGGGMFIQQNGQWRLAGQIYAVDGVYAAKDTPAGQYTMGPIYDVRNFWGDFPIDPDHPELGTERRQYTGSDPIPVGMYATRISTYRSQIDTITGQTAGLGFFAVPEMPTLPLLLLGATVVATFLGKQRESH